MNYTVESENQELAFSPKVSVIIPIYNGEEDLPGLLACLRSQSYPRELTEFWLIDNNSHDNTAKIIQTAIEETAQKGIKLFYLKEEEIQSSYAARNRGIKASTGKILAFTDVDCRPQGDWLETLIKPFINPKISIVAGEIKGIMGNSLLEKYAHTYKVLSPKYCLENSFCPYGQTANLAIRKELLYEVGLFRPYLTSGGDADICWRILKATDTEIEFASEAIIFHRHRNNLKDFKSQWKRYGNSNFYLHKLHGLELMKECNKVAIFYRLSMWLLKELPKITIKMIVGQATLIDLLKTPLDLIRWEARTQGQKEAKTPEQLDKIEWLCP
jgi:glycosyltransferase involved in cell wall biosynthesis